MLKIIYTTYSEELDVTIIFEDIVENEKTISTEIKGFYFGSPNNESTSTFYGKLKAEFK
jgi:hypothetical protein